ncbi:MAG: zinc ribbon domain-containing protein, partial [Candidatus Heimdallarchaeota archaeon]
MTIFCPSCGTANRDEAEMCSECGNVIPRLNDN